MDIPVLHLLNRFWIGGAERQFVERLRRNPKGFSVLVGCLELSGPLLPQIRALGHEPWVFPVNGSLLQANTAKQIALMAALIRDHGVRIVHATDYYTNLLALGAGKLTGAKVIVSRLDLGHLRAGFGRWHREAEKWNARNADLVVANADAVREVCIREEGCDPDRVVVVRNGLDTAHFDALARQPLQAPLPIEDGDLPVAVIGNLWRVKGHRTLVEAAAEIAARIPRVKFLCAGEGPEREALEKRIAELGLEKTVHLLGHRLDIPAILARSRAACLCSSAEGLSNALMEAMASSLPIVATSVGGNPELVRPGENGLLVPFGDARALSTALVQLLSDPAAAAEMGRRGRLRIESELTLEKMAEGHGALYRRALDASAVRAAA
ncbi:MAG: glycosyltransferase [Deltaproteobacteria bacterium]|nr:MAG: glycosyltransferase [Deltaproteobacteria bacterium]